MKLNIIANPQTIKSGNFNYSNIESAYGVNTQYFTKDDKPFTVIAGEMHFSRLPRERWRETLLKMRECSINTVSTYIFWNYHEEIKGRFDFSGNKDISAFLSICRCLSNGSNPGLGFKVDSERRFYVDNDEAAIVREIYERYAAGETKAEIIRDLQRRKVKTSLGKEFSNNSLSRLLSNKRYIGIYLYKGQETPGGMPRILDDDLFYRVQALMNKNKAAPARTHGEGEYLLTTKLFCGYCKEMMVGYGGTGKSGRQYHYYNCKNARKKKCKKKIVSKQYIEDRVVTECLKLLTDENIAFIAKMVAEECNKSPDNISVKVLKKAIQEADTAIENLWRGIEQGQSVEMLTERINKRKAEKAVLEEQLAIEQNKKICLTEPQIHAFLDYVCEMPADDANKRRAIINIFVHSIYLYDDYFTLIINASRKPLSIENIPLDDIETAFSGDTYTSAKCSSMKLSAPPYRANPNPCGSDSESKSPQRVGKHRRILADSYFFTVHLSIFTVLRF